MSEYFLAVFIIVAPAVGGTGMPPEPEQDPGGPPEIEAAHSVRLPVAGGQLKR